MSTDNLLLFIETPPQLFVNVQVYTKVDIKPQGDYVYSKNNLILEEKFKILGLKLDNSINLEEYKLHADLEYRQYQNSKLNGEFCINKKITAPYKLIEYYIEIHLKSFLVNSPEIYISFGIIGNSYRKSKNNMFRFLCGCKYVDFKQQNLKYQIDKTEEQWKSLIEDHITKASLIDITI